MKKIGIITLNGDFNYGNRLQNFALQQVIKREGFYPETLIIEETTMDKIKNKLLIGHPKKIPDYIYLTKKIFSKISINHFFGKNKYKKMLIEKELNIAPFTKKYLNSRYIPTEEKKILNGQYDLFIVGSDQVWNPHIIDFNSTNFLSFTSRDKRYSYAASVSVSTFPDLPTGLKNHFKKYLSEMAFISVREAAGRNLILELTDKKVEVVPDPTLLLRKKDWLEILSENSVVEYNSPYILLYFISEPSKKTLTNIHNFAKEKNLKIIRIMGDFYYKDHLAVDPLKFVKLISEANFVFTDSFHGSVFSIIMNSKFLAFNRTDKKGTLSRLESLLKTYDLDFALQKQGEREIKIQDSYNFEKVNTLLEKERLRGLQIIKDNILQNSCMDS